MANSNEINRYLANRQKEVDGTALYLALAEIEKQAKLAEVYRCMACLLMKNRMPASFLQPSDA
jgi:hypothetical protein